MIISQGFQGYLNADWSLPEYPNIRAITKTLAVKEFGKSFEAA